MKKSVIALSRLAALATLGIAAAAQAQQPMVRARVLSAQPVTQQVPVSDCRAQPPTGGGAAVGALAGGLAGSQIGRGNNGQIAGTMIGAIGGAILGNAVEANQSRGCATRYAQQVIGYDVMYEYAGRQYVTRMGSPPGRWVQVPAPEAAAYAEPPPGYQAQQEYAPPPPDYYPPAPSGVVTAPPPAAYPPPPPGYPYPAPVYVQPPPPAYVAPPVSLGLSIGGRTGHHSRGGVGVGIGLGFGNF
ncbi:MAG: glycine zipper 2TM domain-containing protein [Burkholderiaceae bacterium]|nr:glycine zipper 2TM domain-containing protein [Burkholderiaceae bacterium]